MSCDPPAILESHYAAAPLSCRPGIIFIIGKASFTFPIIPRTSFIFRLPMSESGSEPLGRVSQIALIRESDVPEAPGEQLIQSHDLLTHGKNIGHVLA